MALEADWNRMKDRSCSGAAGSGQSGGLCGRAPRPPIGMGGASFFASGRAQRRLSDDRPRRLQVWVIPSRKGLIEACLEAFKSGVWWAAQDMAPPGPSPAVVSEMAAKGWGSTESRFGAGAGGNVECGLRVPALGIQERMLFVSENQAREALMRAFARWGLQAPWWDGCWKEERRCGCWQTRCGGGEVPANCLGR